MLKKLKVHPWHLHAQFGVTGVDLGCIKDQGNWLKTESQKVFLACAPLR